MAYIFLDESGDLGFDFTKKRTSNYFVITFLFVNHKRPIEKLVSKIHKTLKQTHKSKSGVLHAYHEKAMTRQRLLTGLAKKDCSIMLIYLNKHKVHNELQNNKDALYNYVTHLLLDRIFSKKIVTISDQIHFIASRRDTSKFLNQQFQTYVKKKIQNDFEIDIKVDIKTSFEEKSLQAVDFVSWAVFRKLEYEDDTYYNYIRSKIIEENPLFP